MQRVAYEEMSDLLSLIYHDVFWNVVADNFLKVLLTHGHIQNWAIAIENSGKGEISRQQARKQWVYVTLDKN